jgi:hypothetical protein
MIIKCKNNEVLKGVLGYGWHPILIDLYVWLLEKYEEVILTCGYESRDYVGVHSVKPLRGFDIRSWIYENPEKMVKEINKAWVYDPKRPKMRVAILHDTGRGLHFHLQVCKNTRRK